MRDATRYSPSGDHSGEVYRLSLPFVICVVSVPSTLITQRLCPPLRSDTNTISDPSGLKRGWLSKAGPVRKGVAVPPSTGMV